MGDQHLGSGFIVATLNSAGPYGVGGPEHCLFENGKDPAYSISDL